MDGKTAATLVEWVEETTAALMGLEGRAASERLEQRYSELVSALGWQIDALRTDDAMRLATALATFWRVAKKLAEGLDWCERVLRLPGGEDTRRGRVEYEAGMLAFWKGDDARASALIGQATDTGRRITDPTLTALALCGLARIALRSDVEEARRLGREALSTVEGTPDRLGRSSAIHVLGVAAQMAGDLEEARSLMTQRIALAREMGSYAGVSMESSNLSMVERQLGNLDRAEALAREALEIFHRRDDHWAVPFGLNGLAAVARDRGDHERAITMIGAAEALLESQGAAWPPDEREHYEGTLTATREALDPAAFERARSLGRGMSPAEAVDYALGGTTTSDG